MIFGRFCLICQNTFLICFTRKLHIISNVLFNQKQKTKQNKNKNKKMPNAIKDCDCFFDVCVYCKKNDLFYSEFFNLYLKERNEKRTSFMISTHDNCFIVCCKDFLKIIIEITSLEKLKPLLSSNYFFSNGFDSDSKNDESSYISTNFNIDFFFVSVVKKLFWLVLVRNYITFF